jgi:hypothetical protein
MMGGSPADRAKVTMVEEADLNLRPWEFPALARPHWKPAYGIDREIFAGQQQRYKQLEVALAEHRKRH